ncbi:MAG: hypothetical protein WCO10_01975 [bacterium]
MYPDIHKRLLVSAIVAIFVMLLVANFTSSESTKLICQTICWMILILTPFVMKTVRNVHHKATGTPRDIRELVADVPHRIEGMLGIHGKQLIWLKRVFESDEHKKLVIDSETVCYEYNQEVMDFVTGDVPKYVVLTYDEDGPEPALEAWRAKPGYTEMV